MGFLGVIIALMLRISMSVAITEMVNEPPPKNETEDGSKTDDDRCPPMKGADEKKDKAKHTVSDSKNRSPQYLLVLSPFSS